MTTLFVSTEPQKTLTLTGNFTERTLKESISRATNIPSSEQILTLGGRPLKPFDLVASTIPKFIDLYAPLRGGSTDIYKIQFLKKEGRLVTVRVRVVYPDHGLPCEDIFWCSVLRRDSFEITCPDWRVEPYNLQCSLEPYDEDSNPNEVIEWVRFKPTREECAECFNIIKSLFSEVPNVIVELIIIGFGAVTGKPRDSRDEMRIPRAKKRKLNSHENFDPINWSSDDVSIWLSQFEFDGRQNDYIDKFRNSFMKPLTGRQLIPSSCRPDFDATDVSKWMFDCFFDISKEKTLYEEPLNIKNPGDRQSLLRRMYDMGRQQLLLKKHDKRYLRSVEIGVCSKTLCGTDRVWHSCGYKYEEEKRVICSNCRLKCTDTMSGGIRIKAASFQCGCPLEVCRLTSSETKESKDIREGETWENIYGDYEIMVTDEALIKHIVAPSQWFWMA